MSLLRPRVRDDRGRGVTLWLHKGVPRYLRTASSGGQYAYLALGMLAAFGPCALWFLVLALLPGLRQALPQWAAVAGMFLTVPVMFVLLALVYQQVAMRRWGRLACLADGVCAGCGFDLSGLGPEPDGCTLCPECGAAWRLEGEGTEGQRDGGKEGSESAAQVGPQRGRGE